MTACKDCGEPTNRPETHHVDEQKGNNDPDNLSVRCRRCHMHHHGNNAAVTGRYTPETPRTAPKP